MKKLRGSEIAANILKDFPGSEAVFKKLEIKLSPEKSLVELAKDSKIPLQVLLNNLSKQIGLEVDWPKIEGAEFAYGNTFSASSKLRSGRPEGIKKIMAIHSGKGGVGKTFLTVNLARYLNQQGLNCGILDLDIDCPNISKSFGIEGYLTAGPNKKILPLQKNGIKVVSMGNIIEREREPVLWRGPIMAKAIEQLAFDTDWGSLDVLLIDLPPGTSDVPLTMLNIIKPDQVILITTPDLTSLTDTAKSLNMFEKFKVKVLGIVENMSGEIFGTDRAKEFFGNEKIIGKIPLKSEFASGSNVENFKQEDLNLILETIKNSSF